MSFDVATVTGIIAALLSGGFLIALAARNDAGAHHAHAAPARPDPREAEVGA